MFTDIHLLTLKAMIAAGMEIHFQVFGNSFKVVAQACGIFCSRAMVA
jgi:hypothetical protein